MHDDTAKFLLDAFFDVTVTPICALYPTGQPNNSLAGRSNKLYNNAYLTMIHKNHKKHSNSSENINRKKSFCLIHKGLYCF